MAARRALSRSIPTLTSRTGPSSRLVLAALTPRIMPSQDPRVQMATRRLHATAQLLNPAIPAAAPVYPTTHDPIHSPADICNFIDNQLVPSKTSTWIGVHDPATNNLVARVPQSTDEELRAAVASAQKAFPRWRATSIMAKQQILFKFVNQIRGNWDRL